MNKCNHDWFEEDDDRGARRCCRKCGQILLKDGHATHADGKPLTLEESFSLRGRAGAPLAGRGTVEAAVHALPFQRAMFAVLVVAFVAYGAYGGTLEQRWLAVPVLMVAAFCWALIAGAVFFPSVYARIQAGSVPFVNSPFYDWLVSAFAIFGGMYFNCFADPRGWQVVLVMTAATVPIALFRLARTRRTGLESDA